MEEPSGGLVVVVDQFEEIFTACGDETERQWFVDALDRLARPTGGAVVVLGVRADFYAACTAHPQLRAALRAGPVLLEPMTEDELKDAIRRPADSVGLDVEEGLVEVLLTDLGAAGGPAGPRTTGRLPLLAHALRATWQQRHGHTLTVDGYRVTGGIQGAIATTANRLYDALPPPCQEAARWVFLRLVIVGRDADDSRRRVRQDELLRHAPDPEAAERVLDDFTRGRLLTREQDTVVMTHEVLIRAWPRLRDWIEHDRGGNLVRQDLEEAAEGWEQAGREAAALYRGNRLETALAWAETHDPELSGAARAFLIAARHHQRRGQRLRRAAVATITALAVVASLTAVFAFRQESHAQAAAAQALRARDQAVNAAVTSASVQLAPTDPSLSAQLALTSYRMDPTPEAASRLISTENTPLDTRLPGPRGAVYTVAYSPDGHTLAAGNVDQNLVRLWDVSDPGRPVPLGRPVPVDRSVNSILSLAFSPDGRVLAVGGHTIHNSDFGSGGFVDLWSLTSPSHPVLLSQPKSPTIQDWDAATSIESLAFSPDGRTLAAGWYAGFVSLWDVSRPDDVPPAGAPLDLDCPDVFSSSIAFSPTGHTLAAACDDDAGTIGLWNTTDPAHPRHRASLKAGDNVNSLAFSADSRTLAAGAGDSKVHLWKIADPGRPAPLGKPLTGPAQPVMSVAFSPDGHTLAAGSADHTIHLWNVAHPTAPVPLGRPLTGPGDTVTDVVFSPDSRTLAAGNTDGNVDLWNLPPTRIIGAGGNVASVAFESRRAHPGRRKPEQDRLAVEHRRPRPPRSSRRPAHRPRGPHRRRGIQPGRSHPGRGRQRRHHHPVEHHRPRPPRAPPRHPHRGGRPHLLPGVQPRRPHPRRGRRRPRVRQHRPVGRQRPRPPRLPARHLQRPHAVRQVPGIQPRRHDARGWRRQQQRRGRRMEHDGPRGPHRRADPPADRHRRLGRVQPGRPYARHRQQPRHRHPVERHQPPPPHSQGQPPDRPRRQPVVSGVQSRRAHARRGRRHRPAAPSNLWNVTDPAHPTPIGRPLTVETGFVAVLAFSPDGRTLAATTDDGVATLWDLNVKAAISRICAGSSGALDQKQWSRYVPQLPYDSPCATTE